MWNEGKYVDLWSLIHFLFGILFVFAADFFEITFVVALIVLTVVAALWEVIEFVSGKAGEYFSNRVADIIFSDLGFIFMYFILLLNTVSKEVYTIGFVIFVAIFIALNINGWRNYKNNLLK